MPANTISTISSLMTKLQKQRDHHQAAIDEIDAVFAKFGGSPRAGRAKAGRPAGSGRSGGRASGGKGLRVQGVKSALLAALSSTPQSPGALAAKVRKKVGAKVNITTQLAMLKREKKAKNPSRGMWTAA